MSASERAEDSADGKLTTNLPMSDRFLLRQFRQGTADAATLLYFKYAEQLHALAAARMAPELARRVDADDIVQSVFRTFFRRAALGQYEVPAGGDLWKLLLVMALNKIRSVATHHRSARRDVSRTHGDEAASVAVAEQDDNAAVTTLRLTIEELLCNLSETHRAIIELRIDGHEVADIARQVARSKRSVERALRDFRDQLQGALES